MLITAIEKQPRTRSRRVNVYVDGSFALALSPETVIQCGLRVGDELSAENIEALRQTDVRDKATSFALRLLSYRSRSQVEMRQRLAGKGLPSAVVSETIERLLQLGLLDDLDFARRWVEGRNRSSPRGRRLLMEELRLKGIDRETIEEALVVVNEADAAYGAAHRQAQRLQGCEFSIFQRKLGVFLLRRGFGSSLARSTIRKLWQEGNNGFGD